MYGRLSIMEMIAPGARTRYDMGGLTTSLSAVSRINRDVDPSLFGTVNALPKGAPRRRGAGWMTPQAQRASASPGAKDDLVVRVLSGGRKGGVSHRRCAWCADIMSFTMS